MRTHYDSLAAVKDCVLNLPFCGRFFLYKLACLVKISSTYKQIILANTDRRHPPNKKNVSLAGLFLCLNSS